MAYAAERGIRLDWSTHPAFPLCVSSVMLAGAYDARYSKTAALNCSGTSHMQPWPLQEMTANVESPAVTIDIGRVSASTILACLGLLAFRRRRL